ncbi:MAG TPA: exodeoxyribonuclease V subunit alpha [Syntrophales bacterium]|nr:exodeoxyribonuclease V subunit alpha [Syntrophales bacterium]
MKNESGALSPRSRFSPLDEAFGRFIRRIDGRDAPELADAAAWLSRSQAEGHICLDLEATPEDGLAGGGEALPTRPGAERWKTLLETSPAVGRPGDRLPLILDGSRLYLFRYWAYEHAVVRTLTTLATDAAGVPDEARLKAAFECIFPPDGGAERTDWQKVAAFAAARRRFAVVSGGPGTGKTFTVARILALLIAQDPGRPPAIALAAPTGKAAARLQEAIREARATLALPPALGAAIPETASTLHRLLQGRPGTPYFRYHADRPLPADIVVVDEASMVDLALFAKLTGALRPRARLILLGDKDQLASVEAGAVLGDICDTGRDHGYSREFAEACLRATGERLPADDTAAPGLGDRIVSLRKSYRFGETSGIGALSRAINAGDASRAGAIVRGAETGDVAWRDLPPPEALPRMLAAWIAAHDVAPPAAGDPAELLERFSRARILCALREGPYGVRQVNLIAERFLREKGRIGGGGPWYAGRPVMVTKNDYGLGLFNGDIGMALADPEHRGDLRVFFPAGGGKVRSVPPLRLPEHESVFAMTVHKSQGSEFDDVLFLMPDRDVPVLTRQLVYTAVTRAKRTLWIAGREEIFAAALSRHLRRASGLRDALWGGGPLRA